MAFIAINQLNFNNDDSDTAKMPADG